ncbi:MAG: hypothetical protein D5R97_00065 [Candidatus Syntrophonatronum acetioxidans]|uniref:SHSP domain-containing protein n=1 Tax=Candidatus Syntrophonatronum acetioxidans TaxID=1795816 RepID=A0A424YJC1_9FIRM|nr:MAG: hypothetical protein D5R97_00065 [Candidatus Syntrophonatronum acetioxidans]
MYITTSSPWQRSDVSYQQSFAMPAQTGFSSFQPWQVSPMISTAQSFSPFQISPQIQGYNLPLQTGALNVSPWGYHIPMSSAISNIPGNIQGGLMPQQQGSAISYFNPNLSWQQSMNPVPGSQFSQINPQFSGNMMQQQQSMANLSTGIRSMAGFAQPRVELAETNTDVVVTAELPNVDPNNIYLTATDDSLSISALSNMGGVTSSLHRTVALPTVVRSEHLDINYSNGTLECRIPKSDYAARRRVKVNVTG